MTANLHRILVTISSIVGGLGGIFALPENTTLGIPPEVGAWCAIIAAATTIVATSIRANWPPSEDSA